MKAANVKGTLRGWQWLVEFFWEKHAGQLYRQRDRRVLGKKNLYFSHVTLKDHWKGHVVLASKRQMLDSKAAKMEFKITEWQQLLKQPEKLLTGDDVEVIKESPSVRVIRRVITIGDKKVDVHIKQAKRKKKINAFVDCLRPSRAISAFRLGHMFLTRRIPTPLPMAALERRVGPFLTDSILITETVPAPNLLRFMTSNLSTQPAKLCKTPEWEKSIYRTMENLGKSLQYMHDMGFTHRDLKATNIKVFINKDGVPEIAFLDLDAVRKEFRVLLRQRYKGLTRVFVALQQCHTLTHTGFMRLLMAYMRRPGSGELYYKPYWRLIERWGEKKLQKQIKSRRKKQKAQRKWFFNRNHKNAPAV
jgi:serine/threonine protein kinase